MGSLAKEIRQLLEENDVCEESEELDIDEIVGWAMEDDDCEEMDEGCGSKHKSDDDDDDDDDDDEMDEDINILEGMSAEARELQIFIQNDGQLYRQQHLPIIKNAMTKHGQGKYDSMKAVKLFMYLVDNGAKKYAKEAGPGAKWNEMFPKSVRLQVAAALRDDFEDEARLGNYDEYIPKKYQKKVSGKTIGEDIDTSQELDEGMDPDEKWDDMIRSIGADLAQIRRYDSVGMRKVSVKLLTKKIRSMQKRFDHMISWLKE